MLTPTLASGADMLAKLERERWRAYGASHPTHKADHFYNFCITALAMKDHVLQAVGANEELRNRCYRHWSAIPELAAATEIANTAKHVVLRRGPTTQAVTPKAATLLIAYVDEAVNGGEIEEREIPTFEIVLSDGSALEMFSFTTRVVGYWQAFFDANGISRRDQNLGELHGLMEGDLSETEPLCTRRSTQNER